MGNSSKSLGDTYLAHTKFSTSAICAHYRFYYCWYSAQPSLTALGPYGFWGYRAVFWNFYWLQMIFQILFCGWMNVWETEIESYHGMALVTEHVWRLEHSRGLFVTSKWLKQGLSFCFLHSTAYSRPFGIHVFFGGGVIVVFPPLISL